MLRGLARRLLGVPAAQADGHQTRLARRTPLRCAAVACVLLGDRTGRNRPFASTLRGQDEGFRVGRTVQHMHDFVVTMPGAYHTGFNCGHARSLALASLVRSFIAVELLFASKRAVQHKLCRGRQLLL